MTDTEHFYNIYNSTGKCTVPFRELKELLNAEVLKEICSNKNFSISKLAEKIKFCCIDQYDFWQRLLQLRSCLTPEKILELWSCIISDNGYTDYHKIAVYVPEEQRRIPSHPLFMMDKLMKKILTAEYRIITVKNTLEESDKKLLEDSSLTDELMIDNPAVRYRYCQMQKPGFEMLSCSCLHRTVRVRIAEKVLQAIEEDNAEAFLIYKDIAGIKLSYSLLAKIMQNRAARIFDALIKSRNFFKRTMPIEELTVYCTVQFEDSASTAFLKSIEKSFPGTIKNFRDAWGRNLLWYTVYNNRTAFFHPNCKLSEFLLQNGCDPDNMNHLGFSWRYMMKNLEPNQKVQLLKLRYRKDSKKYPSHLKENQPLDMLNGNQVEPEWMKNL